MLEPMFQETYRRKDFGRLSIHKEKAMLFTVSFPQPRPARRGIAKALLERTLSPADIIMLALIAYFLLALVVLLFDGVVGATGQGSLAQAREPLAIQMPAAIAQLAACESMPVARSVHPM
jgi:hypothetical protein